VSKGEVLPIKALLMALKNVEPPKSTYTTADLSSSQKSCSTFTRPQGSRVNNLKKKIESLHRQTRRKQ